MILLLMMIHLCLMAIVLGGWRAGRFYLAPSVIPLAILLPLWGPVCAVAIQMHVRGGEKADQEAESGRFGITDEVYRSIRMEESGVSEIRPIGDVLETGTPVQRRSLLLSVLHSGADPFVRPLRKAGVNDDTEVVHYAVTALVELRSSYVRRRSLMEDKYLSSPSDPVVLREYAELEEEYLRSNIPENGERQECLAHCRMLLEKLLQVQQQQSRENGSRGMGQAESRRQAQGRFSLLRRIGEICLQQEDPSGAGETAYAMLREAPDREEGYLLLLRAGAVAGDGRKIAEAIRRVRERGVYLSPSGREQVDFWSLPQDVLAADQG